MPAFKCLFLIHTLVGILELVEHDFSLLPVLLILVLVRMVHPGELLVGGADFFVGGGPGNVKEIVELVVDWLSIVLEKNVFILVS